MSSSERTESPGWIPLFCLAAAYLLIYLLWNVLLVFIISAIFAFLIFPIVRLFDRRFPRLVSIIAVYLAILMVLTIFIGLLYPAVTEQVNQLASNMPTYASKSKDLAEALQRRIILLKPWGNAGERVLTQLGETAIRTVQEAIPAVISFVGSLAGLVFIPLFSFFMLLDFKGYRHMLMAVLPTRQRETAQDLLECAGRVLWDFFRAQLILMLAVGLLDGLGFVIIGMPYAAVFALIAGILEVIPSFGPTITTLSVALVAVLIDPVLAVKAVVVTTSVQVLENLFLVPVVMGKAVGLNPITVAFAIFLGGKAAGIPGAIIGIPLAMIAKIIILYFYAQDEQVRSDRTQPSAKRSADLPEDKPPPS